MIPIEQADEKFWTILKSLLRPSQDNMIFFSSDIGASLRQRFSGSLPTDAARTANLFWQQPTKALLLTLRSRSEGLTASEAARRLEETGPNAFHEQIRQRLLAKVAKRMLNPLIAILLVAAAVSGITGDAGSFAIIVTVIVGSIALDIVQEHHAEVAVETLRRSVAVKADVRRDGAVTAVPVGDLVPGDIVESRTGDLVPADGVILEAHNVQVSESLMTGEAFPSVKSDEPCTSATPADASNALFAGTSVVGGSALMAVVATGPETRFGAIAARLVRERADDDA